MISLPKYVVGGASVPASRELGTHRRGNHLDTTCSVGSHRRGDRPATIIGKARSPYRASKNLHFHAINLLALHSGVTTFRPPHSSLSAVALKAAAKARIPGARQKTGVKKGQKVPNRAKSCQKPPSLTGPRETNCLPTWMVGRDLRIAPPNGARVCDRQ